MFYGFNTLSDVFDDVIFNLFGSDINDIFSNTTCYKKTFSANGHTATAIRKPTKDGKIIDDFYLDGKRVKSLPDWAVEGLNNTKALTWKPTFFEPVGCNNKLPDSLISGTEIPHVDVIHKEDGSMRLDFALAGVEEDRIEIAAEDDFLLVTIKPSAKEDSTVRGVYVQRGIKKFDNQLWKKIFIDPKKYDINTLTYTYENGYLTINISKTAEPEKNKLVFKKAANVSETLDEDHESEK